MRHRTLFLIVPALLMGLLILPAPAGAEDDRPNFILFITDDISWNDLGCYGNEVAKTPNLDRMASEGLVFDNAYLTTSSCSPTRCSLITSRYPHNTGAAELHTSLPEDQHPFPKDLKEAGYYTLLSGKHHMGNAVNEAFSKIHRGKGPSRSQNWVKRLRDRPKDKPFFFWLASIDAHRQWQINDHAPTYDPEDIDVPPYLIDGPKTRKDLAQYYHEVSRTDHFAGKLREELERQGIAENTYFIYISDNGRPFPRCKTRLYNSGVKTPMIIWKPGTVPATLTDSLVSTLDLGPTILELAGLDKAPSMQGVSITPVLRDPEATVRDYAFAEHNWHVFQAHERMVRHGPWLYIQNNYPDRQSMCVEAAPRFAAGAELWEAYRSGQPLTPAQRDIFLQPRPKEELYNVERDPHQLHNIAKSKRHEKVLNRMRQALDQWTEQTGDTVPENPTGDRQNVEGEKYPDFERGTMPGEETNATAINHPGPIREADLKN